MSRHALKNLYEAGFSLGQVARISEMPKSSVRDILFDMGVKFRKCGGGIVQVPHDELAKTAFLYERMGWSTNEIAEELGMSCDAICNRLDLAGVPRRTRAESMALRWKRRPHARSKAAA